MKPFVFLFIFVAFGDFLYGCVPVVWVWSVPRGADQAVPSGFAAQTDKVLVLSIWQKAPIYHDRASEFKYLLGAPVVILGKELPELHKKVAGKLAAAFLGADFGIGRNIFFDSVVLISDKGQVAWLEQYGDIFGKDRTQHSWLSAAWLNELRQDFQDQEETARLGRKPVEIPYSTKERSVVLNFLEELSTTAIENQEYKGRK